MILPGVSPIIRAGDSFDAEFTVRNASEHAFTAAVNAKIEGLAGPARAAKAPTGARRGQIYRLESHRADGA